MSAKTEHAPFETIVGEALERMRSATAAPSCYEVDRCNGQWVVRRGLTRKNSDSNGVPELTGTNED